MAVAPVIAPVALSVVNAPVPGVPEPMAPGAAKVAPFKLLAFKLATLVVEATENGAVPVARVKTSCLAVLRAAVESKYDCRTGVAVESKISRTFAGVPVVPLTVSATTEAADGATMLAAVVAGTN